MIFKVYYQESNTETPVREKTKSLYMDAKDEVEVRQNLKAEPFHIEHIEALSNKHLEYEQSQPDFKLWEN